MQNEAEFQKLFAPGTKIEKLADGFKFTDGPVWMGGANGYLIFSDIWSSSGDGAQIFAPDGSRIARILLPKGAANLCFGGKDGKTLFLTARDALYAVETMVRGAGR